MRGCAVAFVILLGTSSASVANAQAPALPLTSRVISVADSDASAVAAPSLEPVSLQHKVLPAAYPLTGSTGWLVAGGIGVLVPLLLFALPALTFAWFGPFAPVAFLIGLLVATLTTAAGGAVAWLLLSLFSNLNSGFLLPVASAAVVGLVSTFVGGALATLIIIAGLALAWSMGAPPNPNALPSSWGDYVTSSRSGPILFGATLLAFCVWGTGVMVAAIGGPMTAASIYQRDGTPKQE